MSVDPSPTALASPRSTAPRSWRTARPVRFVRGVLRQSVAEPVAAGRLRDEGWPYGLRAVVGLAYAMFAIAAVLVVASGPIRRSSVLVVTSSGVGTPQGSVWLLVLLLSFGSAALITAVLHGPGWLKVLGTAYALAIMSSWSLRGINVGSDLLWLGLALLAMIALVVLVVVRWRRQFAWWEFAVCWVLIGGAMVIGLAQSRISQVFGFNPEILLLQQTAATLGFFALPAAMVAGGAVAEVVVGTTVSAVRQAQRLAHRRWPFVILAVIVVGRTAIEIQRYRTRDGGPVAWIDYLPAAGIVVGFAVVGVVVLRIGRRVDAAPVVSNLPEHLGAVGFGVAGALIAVQIPVQLGFAVLQAVASFRPGRAGDGASLDTTLLSDMVDPLRVAVGIVLVGLAVRAARRGRVGRALVQGCVGVMLIALARNLIFPDLTLSIDPDVLNVVGSLVVLAAAGATLARRRLSGERALAYAGVLILSSLFSARDFISDPLGLLLGFSGAALVLFGLSWDLLTGSTWGNGESRRFPRPTRVLLVLTNSVLTMTVLAYAALIRDGSTTIYLDPYASLGDLIFGTALVAAAVIAVLDAASRDAPIG